jgi:hypothetical protein
MRIILGIVAGAVVAFCCVFAIELVGHSLFPPPADINLANPADVERLMSELPAAAFAFVLAGWFLGSLAGAGVAHLLARRALAGRFVGVLMIAACGYTLYAIPHPVWMWVAGIVLPLLGVWLAERITRVPA